MFFFESVHRAVFSSMAKGSTRRCVGPPRGPQLRHLSCGEDPPRIPTQKITEIVGAKDLKPVLEKPGPH